MTKLKWFKKKPIPKWEEGPDASYVNLGIAVVEVCLDHEATRAKGVPVWKVFVAGQMIFHEYSSRGLAKYHAMIHAVGAMQAAIKRAQALAEMIKESGERARPDSPPTQGWNPSIFQASVDEFLKR